MGKLEITCDSRNSEDFVAEAGKILDIFVKASDYGKVHQNENVICAIDMVEMLTTADRVLTFWKSRLDWKQGEMIFRGKDNLVNTWDFIFDDIKLAILYEYTEKRTLSTGKVVESVNQTIRQFVDVIIGGLVSFLKKETPNHYDPKIIGSLVKHIEESPVTEHEDDSLVAQTLIKKARMFKNREEKPLTSRERMKFIHNAVLKTNT